MIVVAAISLTLVAVAATTDAPITTLQWASETMVREATQCLKTVQTDRRGK